MSDEKYRDEKALEHGTGSKTADDALLASLGYKQEFRREFSMLETFGLSFSYVGLVPSIASVLIYAIPNGGPVAMLWGWAVACIFIMFISLAMAELGSAAPTSGGLYYWTHRFSSPRCRNLLSWIVGYTNTIGILSGATGVDFSCAVQIMAAVSIGTDGTFSATTPQIFGVFTALVLIHVAIASLGTKFLARLQNLFMTINILLILAVIIAIPAATPKEFHNKPSFALGHFENSYGWPNGFAFVLSFLAPLWSIGGFDSSVHISEEAANANVVVPFTIIAAPTIGSILGWVINLVFCFFMGQDLDNILSNPIGQPFATILFNSFGKKGSLAIWCFIILVQFFMGVCVLIASSRQTFAFARDGALPFSNYIYSINKSTGTPVNGVIFAGIITWLIGLLTLAGAQATTAVFSLAVCGQYVAYTIPILARIVFKNDFQPGPFSLGRWSKPVAIISSAWMIFTTIVLLFPAAPETDKTTMNYTVVVLGGWIVLAVLGYYFPKYGGVHWFTGPRPTIGKDNLRTPTPESSIKSTEKN